MYHVGRESKPHRAGANPESNCLFASAPLSSLSVWRGCRDTEIWMKKEVASTERVREVLFQNVIFLKIFQREDSKISKKSLN